MKNSMIFLSEYRTNMKQVRDEMLMLGNKEIGHKIVEAVLELINLAETAKREGLLALEGVIEKDVINTLVIGEELRWMILLVTDGTDSEYLEEIMLKRYFSRGYAGLEGALYLLYADVCLEIQAGVSPKLIDESIRALVPREVENDVEMLLVNRDVRAKSEAESGWEELFDREEQVTVDSAVYEDVHLLEKCLLNMKDRDVQSFLRDIYTPQIAVAMKVLNGDAIRRIYDNLGSYVRSEIYKKYTNYMDLKEKDIAAVVQELVRTMQRLEDGGEIHITE